MGRNKADVRKGDIRQGFTMVLSSSASTGRNRASVKLSGASRRGRLGAMSGSLRAIFF